MRATVEQILDQTSKVVHNYDPVYSLIPRDGVRTMLEVGVSKESLLAYSELFPYAEIYGVDIRDKAADFTSTPHIHFQKADAYQDLLVLPYLDVIVDDALHTAEHQLKLYTILEQTLNPGGWYVIEDIWEPAKIQVVLPNALIVRTGRMKDSIIALVQKEW